MRVVQAVAELEAGVAPPAREEGGVAVEHVVTLGGERHERREVVCEPRRVHEDIVVGDGDNGDGNSDGGVDIVVDVDVT